MLTCIYDAAGRLAACASASMRYHPEGPLSGGFLPGASLSVPTSAAKRLDHM
jgi:hypothetical protein